MVDSTLPVGEIAWKNYQNIENVIITKYKLLSPAQEYRHDNICRAVKRLGKAVLLHYNLGERDLSIHHYGTVILEKASVVKLSLSTTKKMINAKISIWEDAFPGIPDYMLYDVDEPDCIEGLPATPARFREQPSLQEALGCDYFELESFANIILNTTSLQAWSLFERIERVVQVELDRLSVSTAPGPSVNKVIGINGALERLGQAVRHKYYRLLPASINGNPPKQVDLEQVDLKQVDLMDLYTFDTMLDAECHLIGNSAAGYERRKSLRQALNLPTDDFYVFFNLQSPLLGKTGTLKNVERELDLSPT